MVVEAVEKKKLQRIPNPNPLLDWYSNAVHDDGYDDDDCCGDCCYWSSVGVVGGVGRHSLLACSFHFHQRYRKVVI